MVSGLLLLASAGLHPIHSSVATVSLQPGESHATVTIRAFADDFPPGVDSAAITRYLAQRFLLLDRAGRPLPLVLHRVDLDGGTILLSLRAVVSGDLRAGARVWHGVLAERYPDQVNLVQVRVGPRTATLIFTAGDGPKPLPGRG
ncbi:MAG: DUF6702 family protein [Gemmatimonadales bacterium]